jgi:hypothetical protein
MKLHFVRPKAAVLLLALFVLAAPGDVQAAPVRKLVVNEGAKQCAWVFGGDECSDCVPVDDAWKIVEPGMGQGCPGDFQMVRVELKRACRPFKRTHCCTKGHSGVQGDCEDMVINDQLKKCAFVDDLKSCALPAGWMGKPQAMPAKEWECPYAWESVDCLKAK